MIVPQNQEQLESLFCRIGSDSSKHQPLAILYFTADWCKACRLLDLPLIVNSFPKALFYKIDIDKLENSAGWCNVRTIPAFIVLKYGKFKSPFTSSNTQTVIDTIKETLGK